MGLLRRFALGDIDAFETLVRQLQGDIYAWIMRIVRDPGIAEDLTVETLWRIYRARQQFGTDGNFPAWARRIRHQPGARPSPPQSSGTESIHRTPRGDSARSPSPAGDSGKDPAGISPTAGDIADCGNARDNAICNRAVHTRNAGRSGLLPSAAA